MTLEHVHDTATFIRSIRADLGRAERQPGLLHDPRDHPDSELRAFWDIYYEHCSYFSPGSLGRLFRHAGFDPVDIWTDYDDQYVLIAARPGTGTGPWLANEHGPEALAPKVGPSATVAADRARWRGWLAELHAPAKGRALGRRLQSGGLFDHARHHQRDELCRRRQSAALGHLHRRRRAADRRFRPSSPYRPDVVLIMSPIYTDEIRAELEALGLQPAHLLTVEAPPEALQAA